MPCILLPVSRGHGQAAPPGGQRTADTLLQCVGIAPRAWVRQSDTMSSTSPQPSKAALICITLSVVNITVAFYLLIRSYTLPSDISAASQSVDLLMESRSEAGSIWAFLLLFWGWSHMLIYFIYKALIDAGISPPEDASFFEEDNLGGLWIRIVGALSVLIVLAALFGIVYRDYFEVKPAFLS